MVALVAVLAAGLIRGGPEVGMEKLIAALTGVAEGSRPSADLAVTYADGNGLDGVTSVTVALGAVHVTQTRPKRAALEFRGPLLPAEAATLARRALDGKLWTVVPARQHGVPDETRPELRVGVQGAGDVSVALWANEADDVPAFATVREQVLAIAPRVSGGRVTY